MSGKPMPSLSAILEKKKGMADDDDEAPESGEEEADDSGELDAANAILDAIKADDPEALVAALKSMAPHLEPG